MFNMYGMDKMNEDNNSITCIIHIISMLYIILKVRIGEEEIQYCIYNQLRYNI